MFFSNVFSKFRRKPTRPSLPQGERMYAIGDIHGCRAELTSLFAMLDADEKARGPARTSILFLGDYVDRGPDSRGVIETLMKLDRSDRRAIFLMGNHEELMVLAARGDRRAAGMFDKLGGRTTLLSYGVDPREYDSVDHDAFCALIARAIPSEHIAWLAGLPSMYKAGDYVFAHAGVRPGIALDQQTTADLRWIRREFLDYPASHPAMIIHGHSAFRQIDEQHNRIGIDTGAYATGQLTAIGLEGRERWFLQTGKA